MFHPIVFYIAFDGHYLRFVSLVLLRSILFTYNCNFQVRNIEYKDPVEEEWEKFQKEIKEEATASAEIIAGEQEEATAERQIEEIDEQIRMWSKLVWNNLNSPRN